MKFIYISNIHTEYLALYITSEDKIQQGYSRGAKRLVQSISLEKLLAETLSPSGPSMEERHIVE
jgi:hypothetical protein